MLDALLALMAPYETELKIVAAGTILLGSAVVSYLSYRRRWLTGQAALTACGLSVGLYLTGGLRLVVLLLTFFIGSTLLTHYRQKDKDQIEADVHEKKGPRDTFQVIANGGPALLMGILTAATGQTAFLVGSAAALAASNADTWASELGVLSRHQPVFILSRRPVAKGLSGGVTRLGTLAALSGGVFIALVYGLLHGGDTASGLPLVSDMAVIALAGLIGSTVDSVLGETVQARYASARPGHLTEKSSEQGRANSLQHGLKWLNNDWVNLLSSTIAALAAAGLIALSTY
jgi:uncharacterized protein (TIGR00297 family)